MKQLHTNQKLALISELFNSIGINSVHEQIIEHSFSFKREDDACKIAESSFSLNAFIFTFKKDDLEFNTADPERIMQDITDMFESQSVNLDMYQLDTKTSSHEEAIDYFFDMLSQNYILIWQKPEKNKSDIGSLSLGVYTTPMVVCCFDEFSFKTLYHKSACHLFLPSQKKYFGEKKRRLDILS